MPNVYLGLSPLSQLHFCNRKYDSLATDWSEAMEQWHRPLSCYVPQRGQLYGKRFHLIMLVWWRHISQIPATQIEWRIASIRWLLLYDMEINDRVVDLYMRSISLHCIYIYIYIYGNHNTAKIHDKYIISDGHIHGCLGYCIYSDNLKIMQEFCWLWRYIASSKWSSSFH